MLCPYSVLTEYGHNIIFLQKYTYIVFIESDEAVNKSRTPATREAKNRTK